MAHSTYNDLVVNRSIVPLRESGNPGRFLLKFPDSGGIAAGRFEAAEHFATAIGALEEEWGRQFRFLPFTYEVVNDVSVPHRPVPSEIAVTSYLAV